MNLTEAKKILNDNGYKVELNEDLRKASKITITEASKYDYEY